MTRSSLVGFRHDLRNTGNGPLKVLVIWGEPRAADYSDFGSVKMAKLARTEAPPAASAPEHPEHCLP